MGSRRLARLLCAALALAAATPAVAAAADTWAATASETVFPDTTRPAEASGTLSIATARDDYEGGQVVIRSDAALTVTPTVSALTGPATIPASAIRLYRIGYVKLSQPSTGVDALHGDGRYPDPLIPVDKTMDVPAGETTSLYVLVHVPADAAAGTYNGTVDLGPAGQVPLQVDVAPVTVNRDDYRITARMSAISLARELGVPHDDPTYIAGLYRDLLPMLREHGISPGRAPQVFPTVNTDGSMTWGPQQSSRLDSFLGMNFATVEVPFLPNLPWEDRLYNEIARRKAAAQAIATRYGSSISNAYALAIDEPRPDEYDEVVRAAEQLHAANPPIPVMTTEPPSKAAWGAMSKDVDIWTPPLWDHYKDPAASAKVLSSGKKLWWYVYGSDTQRFTPNVLIDKPTTEPRLLGWLAERDGIQGFFYWGLNNWEDGKNGPQSPSTNPWFLSHTKVDVQCLGGQKREVGGNGEASLIWPGPSASQPAYGSMRLEALRDGAEDHALLAQLKDTDPAYHDRVLSGLIRPYTGASDGQNACMDASRPGYLPVVETSPASVDATRRAVLDRLSGKPLPSLTGRIVFAGGSKGVPAAVVRFSGFETTTDRNGNWSLPDVPNSPGTLTVSRDPAGLVDPAQVEVSTADLAAGTVATPAMPAPVGRPLMDDDLSAFAASTVRPAKVKTVPGGIIATIGNRYKASGDSTFSAGGRTPSVEATYARIPSTKAARNWKAYRYLDMDVEVLKNSPEPQRWYLIVTPGGHYMNGRNLSIGRTIQHVRVDLRAAHPDKGPMRRMDDVRYVRFGLQSALPKTWRGGHTPTVTLKITDMTLIK